MGSVESLCRANNSEQHSTDSQFHHKQLCVFYLQVDLTSIHLCGDFACARALLLIFALHPLSTPHLTAHPSLAALIYCHLPTGLTVCRSADRVESRELPSFSSSLSSFHASASELAQKQHISSKCVGSKLDALDALREEEGRTFACVPPGTVDQCFGMQISANRLVFPQAQLRAR